MNFTPILVLWNLISGRPRLLVVLVEAMYIIGFPIKFPIAQLALVLHDFQKMISQREVVWLLFIIKIVNFLHEWQEHFLFFADFLSSHFELCFSDEVGGFCFLVDTKKREVASQKIKQDVD